MSEPAYWTILTVIVAGGIGTRLLARRPLWPSRASALRGWELVMLGAAVLALVFHCAAMFFAAWVDAVPFLETPAEAVRELGAVSQVAYWVPALAAVVALRAVWPPALILLVTALVGVGVTMFWPYELTTHLGWIAAAVVLLVAVPSGLVTAPRRGNAAHRTVT